MTLIKYDWIIYDNIGHYINEGIAGHFIKNKHWIILDFKKCGSIINDEIYIDDEKLYRYAEKCMKNDLSNNYNKYNCEFIINFDEQHFMYYPIYCQERMIKGATYWAKVSYKEMIIKNLLE